MSGWLGGFRSSGAEASSEPQPFELVCECNVRHTGLRKKTHQRIICRTCGASLFVLPRDAYPPPPEAEKIRKKKRKPKPTPGAEDDSAPKRVSRHQRRREQEGSGSNPFAAAASMSSSAFQVAVGSAGRATRTTVMRASQASLGAVRGFWNFWTPLRLAGLGIVVLLTGSMVWTVHARRVERAEQELNPAIEEGLAALQQGDISEATARLATAAAALDLLGKVDRHSDSVRQAYLESRALGDLASEALLDLLEQADESVEKAARVRAESEPPDPDAEPPPPLDADWANRFAALYQGGWIVMEAPVRGLKPTDDEPRRFQVEFPIGVGPHQRKVVLRADFTVFEELGLSDKPRTVIFGGRLESCRFDEANDTWRVSLAESSGFAWINLQTYRQLGFLFTEWHSQAEVETLLASQAKALGVDSLVKDPPIEAPSLAPQ